MPWRFAEMTRFCSLKVDQTRNWIHRLIWRTPNTRSSDSISSWLQSFCLERTGAVKSAPQARAKRSLDGEDRSKTIEQQEMGFLGRVRFPEQPWVNFLIAPKATCDRLVRLVHPSVCFEDAFRGLLVISYGSKSRT